MISDYIILPESYLGKTKRIDLMQPIVVEIEGAVATVVLNRPDRMNAINREMADMLVQTIEALSENSSIRAVILTGAGGSFSAGGDVGDLAKDAMFPPGANDAEKKALLRYQVRSAELLTTMPKLTIAAIEGACVGAAFSLAAACDIRYATPDAVFSTAFLSVGLSGDYGGTWSLVRLLGSARARELYLLSPKFNGVTAERIGFVAQLSDSNRLRLLATEKAQLAANFDAAAFARTKQNLLLAETESFSKLLDAESEAQIMSLSSGTVQRAAAAFLNRKK